MTYRESPVMPARTFQQRRSTACDALGDGVLVLTAAPIQYASRDNERPYHPDRELYYLTGVTEPGSVAVITGGAEPRFVLFVRARDPDAELWSGPRLGPDAAREAFAPDECHDVARLGEILPPILQERGRIHFRLGRGGAVEQHVLEALHRARVRGARTGSGARGIIDPGEILDDLRLVKDEHEIQVLRRAATISLEGHRVGAATLGPGVGEWVVEAAVDGSFRASGARGPAYESIVGSGARACVLHYIANSAVIERGDLVLVDAGAEYALYHGDVTRTYPASGRFSDVQREVYEVVELARRAAIDVVRPGASIGDVHGAATHALVEGLIGLGVLRGSPADLIDQGEHKAFFPHQTSHWVGLDVHDPGDYERAGVSRRLEPGMVFTVEPGLYFRPTESSPEGTHFTGIGIRIEDDVVVTESGAEVLTAALPTSPSEVEGLVESGS
jgi:Xaa-Pro aminopeptidase